MKIILKPKREDSLLRKHPWVFSGAVAKIEGRPEPGETVDIYSSKGSWLGRGGYSPKSQICVRVWTFREEEQIDNSFFRSRLEKAIQRRQQWIDAVHTTAYRLVNAESDGLPGLIVDRYGDYAVLQFLSRAADRWRDTIVTELAALLPLTGYYERSDVKSRAKEGLEQQSGTLMGAEPPELVPIVENGIRFQVDIRQGHKTGLYLDQRENRAALIPFCRDREVLNAFSYSGGFGLAALSGGASRVVNIDTSSQTLELASANAELNGFDMSRMENITGDVFAELRRLRAEEQQFDVIVLDPPKFAENSRQVIKAARGYKDINRVAMQLLRPGGYLFTFSCSGHVIPALFQKIVADAALDAGCDIQIIRQLGQAADHPVLTTFPEGWYLKGLICRKD